MRRLILLVASGAVIAGCAIVHPVTRPPTAAAVSWDERRKDLGQATRWDLDGRAAVALGQQGW